MEAKLATLACQDRNSERKQLGFSMCYITRYRKGYLFSYSNGKVIWAFRDAETGTQQFL